MSKRTAGALGIAACAFVWGGLGIVVREVHASGPSIALVQEVQATAVTALGAFVWRRSLLRPPDLRVSMLGALLAVHFLLFYAAVRHTSVASAVLVTYSAPIFVALLAPAMLRERIPPVSVGALVVSGCGMALISTSGGGEVHASGLGLALLAALLYALLIVLLKRWAHDTHPLTAAVWQSVAATVVLLPPGLAGHVSFTPRDIGYLVVLGVVISGLTGVAYLAALRFVPATTAGILGYIEPVSAAILAAAILGEPLTGPVVAGGLAIIAAGVAVVLADSRVGEQAVAPVPGARPG
jgi:DME family drug/metabolite transporter